jgi:adenylyl-sulfate kinase
LTGLSGSGKSTIANALEKKLFGLGNHAYVLDGDNVRLGLNKDLGFTREDRAENVRRVSEVAHNLYEAGLIAIVALVSPYSDDRKQAKAIFPDGDFLEVWVKTPAEVCAERDPKGLYKKAASGELPNLTGVGQEYQDYYTNQLSGTLASGDVELVVGLDLTNRDSFVMPVKKQLEIFEDDSLHRHRKAGLYGWTELGFAVLDNRRVLAASF